MINPYFNGLITRRPIKHTLALYHAMTQADKTAMSLSEERITASTHLTSLIYG